MTLLPTEITPSEERAVAAFMERLRTAPVERAPGLPGADILRIKAKLIREWEAHRRVRLPLEVMAPIEIAAGATAALLLLLWSVPGAFAWVPRLTF